MSQKSSFRYRQAHPKDESDWELIILIALIGLALLAIVVWGVPSGLPS